MTDITRKRGDTTADQVTIQDSSSQAVDITGFSFILTINSLLDPPDTTTEIYSLIGAIIDAAGGVVEFVPSAVQSDQKAIEYYYDIQMTDTISRIKTIEKGKYTFTQDITK